MIGLAKLSNQGRGDAGVAIRCKTTSNTTTTAVQPGPEIFMRSKSFIAVPASYPIELACASRTSSRLALLLGAGEFTTTNGRNYNRAMLSLKSPQWEEIVVGDYDPRPALRGLAAGQDHWSEIWDQHTCRRVSLASYAMVPHLVALVRATWRAKRPTCCRLLTNIEVARHQPARPLIPNRLLPDYLEAYRELSSLAPDDLTDEFQSLVRLGYPKEQKVITFEELLDDPEALGKILCKHDLVAPRQIERALSERESTSYPFAGCLIRLGILSEKELCQTLASEHDIEFIDLEGVELDPELGRLIPEHLAQRYKAFPVAHQDPRLILAMVDPLDIEAILDIELISGFQVIPTCATEENLLKTINQQFGVTD